MVTKGASARGLFARIQRARTFLPVPLSPRSSSTASDAAARAADWRNLQKQRAVRLEERRLAALVELLLKFHQPAP